MNISYDSPAAVKSIKKFIVDALNEDVRDGDHTSIATIDADATNKARCLIKDDGILAGVEFAKYVFDQVDPKYKIDIRFNDGDQVVKGNEAFYVECKSRSLLTGERLVLNMMQRMSGIATMSKQFAEEVKGTNTKILDTRKTTPLLRFFEKWAVKIGGCENYRFGLYDWIMIKDNHVDACGSHEKAIKRVHEYFKKTGVELGITVEVRNLDELREVLSVGGITQVMFDNFSVEEVAKAVEIVGGKYKTEASGGMTLPVIKSYAETGLDYISVGALTHSFKSMDISLKVMKD